MSIGEFTSALRNKAISQWFTQERNSRDSTKLANINTIINPTSLYRDQEQAAAKTDFLITNSTIKSLISTFKVIESDEVLEVMAKGIYTQLAEKPKGTKINRRKITVNNEEAILFTNISFSAITEMINRVLSLDSTQLQQYYQRGHVFGLNTVLLDKTRARLVNSITGVINSSSTSKEEAIQAKKALDLIVTQIDNVVKYYKSLDAASANIKVGGNNAVYAGYSKKLSRRGSTKYLVELQLKEENQASGKEVQKTVDLIRKLLDPSFAQSGEAKYKDNLDKLLDKVGKDTTLGSELLNLRGSPSIKELMSNLIVDTIKGTPTDANYSLPKQKVATETVLTTYNLQEIKKQTKLAIKAAEAAKQKIQKLKAQKPKVNKVDSADSISLIQLRNLLNKFLFDAMAANMGDGDSRNVLNYRTGRLAASAKVERLTSSREGLITAFYSYQKNPYATFSEGGRQQYPKTRDPKLLISKSIRDIAKEYVTNQLRSVNI